MIVYYKRFYQGSINPLMDSISHMVSIFPKWTRVARRHHLHTISLVAIEKQQYCCKRAMQYKKFPKWHTKEFSNQLEEFLLQIQSSKRQRQKTEWEEDRELFALVELDKMQLCNNSLWIPHFCYHPTLLWLIMRRLLKNVGLLLGNK